ncbi:hypothetical protein [Clostridium botulinum]|uniref:hypothetical protein n=1 Tax=Clostridium botulinum TaxID=1491 RepID=UPI001E406858|nr:hypothetical protein [Clostridium botulinum]MCD3223805.1 hypothetical protein [Clostridium botulinum C/D]MCD3295295.1 hypothetical protein [Clostridium botulinum C/D]
MGSIAKRRMLLKTIKELVHYLNEQEIRDIGNILLKATKRLEKQWEEKHGQASKK